MALRRESPFGRGEKRAGSSPPSPVLDLPPIRFIASAIVSCAPREIEPKLMAPVANLLRISLADSTSDMGMGFVFVNVNRLRSVVGFLDWSFMSEANSR